MSAATPLQWEEGGVTHRADWCSPAGHPPPRRLEVVDDRLTADAAYRLACAGTALLWRGDFQNARQLLQALARRIDRKPSAAHKAKNLTEAFHLHRQAQAQRARLLGLLLVPVTADGCVPLRRAPDVALAFQQAYGVQTNDVVTSLRELQGVVGAYEWRRKGVMVPALGAAIHPHYGVFSPVRGEYVALVDQAPLPTALQQTSCAFDVGTGTGVLAAILARRGIAQVVATDLAPAALACAQENLQRLGLAQQVSLQSADLFPTGRAALVVCNPPWLPGKPASALETAVYDPDSRMLRGFLAGLAAHLVPGGEGWLIMSDLAELLGLRPADALRQWMAEAGLQVLGRHDTRPVHGKAFAADDPLHAARRREVTSLWRLAPTR